MAHNIPEDWTVPFNISTKPDMFLMNELAVRRDLNSRLLSVILFSYRQKQPFEKTLADARRVIVHEARSKYIAYENRDANSNGDKEDEKCPLQVNLNGRTRLRVHFSPKQLEHLNGEFRRNKHPKGMKCKEIAKELNLTTDNVRTWFHNQRARVKRGECKV